MIFAKLLRKNFLVEHLWANASAQNPTAQNFPLRISSMNVFPADLAAFTEEILNGKFHFLCSVRHAAAYPFSIIFFKNARYPMSHG